MTRFGIAPIKKFDAMYDDVISRLHGIDSSRGPKPKIVKAPLAEFSEVKKDNETERSAFVQQLKDKLYLNIESLRSKLKETQERGFVEQTARCDEIGEAIQNGRLLGVELHQRYGCFVNVNFTFLNQDGNQKNERIPIGEFTEQFGVDTEVSQEGVTKLDFFTGNKITTNSTPRDLAKVFQERWLSETSNRTVTFITSGVGTKHSDYDRDIARQARLASQIGYHSDRDSILHELLQVVPTIKKDIKNAFQAVRGFFGSLFKKRTSPNTV